jgi:thymidylate synthase (FAD)
MINANKVELLGYYGSDETIALSAWTSTSRELSDEKRERIPALINQLWSADPVPHGTPFEKGMVHFLVTADIATHIHFLKHRISSVNAESARYKELKEDKVFVPVDFKHAQLNYDEITDPEVHEFFVKQPHEPYNWGSALSLFSNLSNALYHEAVKQLTPQLGRKRAKESARYFKLYNSQITFDVMFNLRSFHNFYTQRADKHAQVEVREIALQMMELIKGIEGQPFKNTLKAWDV